MNNINRIIKAWDDTRYKLTAMCEDEYEYSLKRHQAVNNNGEPLYSVYWLTQRGRKGILYDLLQITADEMRLLASSW